MIELSPRARMPKQFEMKGGKKARGGKKHFGREVDSSDSEDSFELSRRRHRSKSRGTQSRPRSRARIVVDDSSDDSFASLGRRLNRGRRGRW